MTLCGRLFCEKAISADSKTNPIDNIVTARRIFEFSERIETTGQRAGIVV
jgi:hypothetical protein